MDPLCSCQTHKSSRAGEQVEHMSTPCWQSPITAPFLVCAFTTKNRRKRPTGFTRFTSRSFSSVFCCECTNEEWGGDGTLPARSTHVLYLLTSAGALMCLARA